MFRIFKEKSFTQIEPINKGWSSDKKYCVTKANGKKYLFRISPLEKYELKKHEYEMMQRVASLGVPMCQPIEFGICNEGVFSLQSWIEGFDAEEKIPDMPLSKQYQYGIKAGKILKEIHSIPAPSTLENWETRFNRKIDRKLKAYSDCPFKYDQGEVFIKYINANRHLLKNRPQCYQHGDYHFGNMMIDNNGNLIIIDFNRNDFGDPWEEFNRIVWCANKSTLFASGIVNGYFNEDLPLEFWGLLALYIATNTISSLPWAIPFGENEINTMRKQAKQVLHWYDNMNNPVPIWYSNEAL